MGNQKAILFFLLKFVVLYIVLNTGYAMWISHYNPLPDPLTKIVTIQAASLISLTEDDVTVGKAVNSPNVPIRQGVKNVINVFEGCNSLNVMIVFISFVIAFTGTLKKTFLFCVVGVLLIYVFNLFRVALLFYVARYYPDNLYFFHKFLFTGLLYVLVFFLWYLWVKKIWPKKI